MDYQILHDELAGDPLSRGYTAMTHAEAAADLNTAYRVRLLNHLSSAQIYEEIVSSEFQALTDAQKVYVRDILGLGEGVDVQPGSQARAVMIQVFGSGSTTLANLAAMLQVSISRANELGLGSVTPGDVERALAYPVE